MAMTGVGLWFVVLCRASWTVVLSCAVSGRFGGAVRVRLGWGPRPSTFCFVGFVCLFCVFVYFVCFLFCFVLFSFVLFCLFVCMLCLCLLCS